MYTGKLYQVLALVDKLSPYCHGQSHVTCLNLRDPSHISIMGKHFKFSIASNLVCNIEHLCMHDRLCTKGMCAGSHVLFKFWEIMDYIC